MCDLAQVLPDFNLKPYSHLLHSLEKNEFTVTDLVSLDPVEIARRCPLPLLDVRRLIADVIEWLQRDLNMLPPVHSISSDFLAPDMSSDSSVNPEPTRSQNMFVRTLDLEIDALLGGGFPAGYVTEVVGESAVGKTQILFGLLLSVQLPVPQGLGKGALYISTEDPLNTVRLAEILQSHPYYAQLPDSDIPSFDRIHAKTVTNLAVQQQLIEFQLPIAVERLDIGLIILDSVAANFRADRDVATTNGLVDRAVDLAKVGGILRRLAVEKNIAVVVANQVSDRFAESLFQPSQDLMRSSSPSSSVATPSQLGSRRSERDSKMTLDHQSRFFTGWGDKPAYMHQELKAPALGLAWANQIDARIVLKVEAETSKAAAAVGKRRRFMNVVFAPWAGQRTKPLEYSIEQQGIVAKADDGLKSEHQELLDETLWADADDDEFP
ncbi:uncharacterized protein HMPREF1541_10786 [Cyphellophora europaea CBS 101466]|uniref:RecA family profile 1 domain-containing protein n=1 Tax=Cyphellophora europaea (strain CBS 101466) TaxID=1220924 RepID=W2S6H9_CYPE1|nr:uncharacterized protein HMPREF1541_10786 [Cyphellophora europaea CBS 101466]ETN44235.1 hypothetical protein HMPREF1541_10786 [Cyphellophora europaea CBS 101466]